MYFAELNKNYVLPPPPCFLFVDNLFSHAKHSARQRRSQRVRERERKKEELEGKGSREREGSQER